MSNITPFEFDKNEIRVIMLNGEPWFSLDDICLSMDLSNPTIVASRLDQDELAKFDLGRQRPSTIINEAGLYSVILRSDKPEAKRFKRWITHEVLPSIRKTGSYSSPSIPEKAKDAIKPLLDANRLFKSNLSVAKAIFKGNQAILSANKATRQTTEIDVLEQMGATHLISESKDALLTASDIGAQIGLSGQKVNAELVKKGLIVSFRDHKNRKKYELTDAGEKVGEALDTGKKHSNGTPVKQIKWYSRVVRLLAPGQTLGVVQ